VNNIVRYVILPLIIFLLGNVAGINASHLSSLNPSYNYSWWKVLFAIMIAVICSFLIYNERE
jgi:hypothetical protein